MTLFDTKIEPNVMSENSNNQIYIRLLDGTACLVPVKAVWIESNLFRITDNQYLDFEDGTSIWEFFPNELVECEFNNSIWIAKKLVESAVPDRKIYELIFRIVDSLGNIKIDEFNQMRDTIIELYKRDDIIQKQHPMVQKWLENQKLLLSHK